MRHQERRIPSLAQAWGIGLGYGPILPLLLIAFGIDYTGVAQSAQTIRNGVAFPILTLSVVLAIIITRGGWWKTILWDERPVPRWLLLMPLLMAITIALTFDSPRVAQRESSFLFWAALGTLGVGFCEEVVYRGIAVVGFRERMTEWMVWLFSSLLFALIHFWNTFAGQSWASTQDQLITTFIFGSFMYTCRRASGTLLVPMLLHAAWDFSLFASAPAGKAASNSDPMVGYLMFAMMGLFVVGAKWLFAQPAPASRQPTD